MRLPHGTLDPGSPGPGLLLFLLLIACGPAKPQPLSSQGLIYPAQSSAGKTYPWTNTPPPAKLPTQNNDQDKTFFAARVDAEGLIHLGEAVVTEEQYLAAARQALDLNDDVVAVLFIESSMFQGIHLSEILSKAGYKNVQIYYPTATNR